MEENPTPKKQNQVDHTSTYISGELRETVYVCASSGTGKIFKARNAELV